MDRVGRMEGIKRERALSVSKEPPVGFFGWIKFGEDLWLKGTSKNPLAKIPSP
jgi:hypothetical protein